MRTTCSIFYNDFFFMKHCPKCFWLKNMNKIFLTWLTKKLWFFCCRKWLLTIFSITLLLRTWESISLGFWIGSITPLTTPHKAHLGCWCVRRTEALRVAPKFEPPVLSYLGVKGGKNYKGHFLEYIGISFIK